MEEREKIDSERALFEHKTLAEFAERFEKSKLDLQSRMLDVTAGYLLHLSECEASWLDFRKEETNLFFALRKENEEGMLNFARTASQCARQEAEAIIEREKKLLDEKQAQIYGEVEKQRLLMEDVSRERAMHLLDERNKIQEEAEKQRATEEAKLWEELERKVLEKERQAEADRRVLELELRSRYESLINSERGRVDALMEQHRREAKTMYEAQEQKVREQEQEWHKQRLAIELEERNSHEKQYHDLRVQCEKRVEEERKKLELRMQARETEFDVERSRLLDSLGGQFKDEERLLREQLHALKDEYEKHLKLMMQESQQEREQHIVNVAEQENRFQQQREAYEAEATKKLEKALADLRGTLEKRTREQQTKELEFREATEKSRREYEEKVHQQYEALLQEHKSKLVSLHDEKEAQITELEKQHQTELIRVRQEMEKGLTSYFENADSRARESTEVVKAQFQKRLDEFTELLRDERKKRLDVEKQLATALEDMDGLRSSVEQHKLEIHRSLNAKFDREMHELKEKLRKEKEEMARMLLEEEEKKLARELVAKDADMRKGLAQRSASQVSAPTEVGTPSITPAATTNTRIAAPLTAHLAKPTNDLSEDEKVSLNSVNKRREKLIQLWQVLDYPTKDREQYFDKLYDMLPSAQLEDINREIRRFELQLPLLEVITRREYVLHKAAELKKTGASAAQLAELQAELLRLNDHLKIEIPKHEARFGTPFTFRGRRYMDQLLAEIAGE